MILRLLVAAVLLAGLVVWERALIRGAAATRQARTEDVGRVLAEEELDQFAIAAVRLEWGDGRRATYAPGGGLWRCLDAFNAPADTQALEGLIGAVTRAEGRVQSDDPAQAATYGIGTSDTVRFSLCDQRVLTAPEASVLWSADLGNATPDGEGSFLRPRGSTEIWAVDQNPRPALETSIQGLPPLLDKSVVTAAWLRTARGFERVFIDRADGSALELRMRPREVTEEEQRQGVPPYEWMLLPEGDPSAEPVVLPIERAMAYTYFLQRVGYSGILDPRRVGELGMQGPHDVVTLVPVPLPPQDPSVPAAQPPPPPPEPLALHVLPRTPSGGVPLANPFVDTLYELDAEVAALLVPSREQLLDATAPNPWNAWLEAQR